MHMKKLILTTAFVFLYLVIVQAQCVYDDIIPFNHGVSKFKTLTFISSIDYIKEDLDAYKYIEVNA